MDASKLEQELEKIKKTDIISQIEEFKIKQTNELIENIERLRLTIK